MTEALTAFGPSVLAFVWCGQARWLTGRRSMNLSVSRVVSLVVLAAALRARLVNSVRVLAGDPRFCPGAHSDLVP